MSIQKKRQLSQSSMLGNSFIKLENKENLNSSEVKEMLDLLQAYETLCIQRQDFNGADSVKIKIEQLKAQELISRKEDIAVKQKQQVEFVCKEGEEQITRFQAVWDQEIQKLIAELKQIEEQLTVEQQKEKEMFLERMSKEQTPIVKYSPIILEKRKYLSNLIRARNYKQAENVKKELKEREKEEQVKWAAKIQQRRQWKLQQLEKKQGSELQALRVKLQAAFNERIKERDRKFEILLKKNRKRRIQSSKPSRERIRSRNGLLSESKLNLNLSFN